MEEVTALVRAEKIMMDIGIAAKLWTDGSVRGTADRTEKNLSCLIFE
jgi:hypothetical protein